MIKDIEFSLHAQERMKERGIDENEAGVLFINAERRPLRLSSALYSKYRYRNGFLATERRVVNGVEFIAREERDKWIILTVYKRTKDDAE